MKIMRDFVKMSSASRNQRERNFDHKLKSTPNQSGASRVEKDSHALSYGKHYRTFENIELELIEYITSAPGVFPILIAPLSLHFRLPNHPDTSDIPGHTISDRDMAD